MTEQNTALAKRAAAELAAIPEWMRGDEEALALNMELPEVVARLAIAQSLTPQTKKNKDSYIPGLEVGQMFNTVTGEVYPASIDYVVLHNWGSSIYFDGDGGVKCRSENGKGCSLNRGGACCNMAWGSTGNKKEDKPKCTEFLNLLVYLVEQKEIVVLSFKSTGLKPAKQSLQKMRSSQKGVADFAKVFTLTTKYVEEGNNDWYEPIITRPEMKAGEATVGKLVTDKALYDKLKDSVKAIRARGAVKVHDAEGRSDGAAEGQTDADVPF